MSERCPGEANRNLLLKEVPGGSDGKVSPSNVGDLGLIPGSERSPGEGNGNPTPVFLPGESHGWRSLVGYSPWGHKESDTTERLHQYILAGKSHGPEEPGGLHFMASQRVGHD